MRGGMKSRRRLTVPVVAAALGALVPGSAGGAQTAPARPMPTTAPAEQGVANQPIVRPAARRRDAGVVGRSARVESVWYQSAPVALGLVLVVIAVCGIVARRFVRPSAAAGGVGALEIVARVHLAPKQSICLIRAGPRLILVGVTPDHVEHLTDIDDPDAAAQILAAAEARKPDSSTAAFRRLVDEKATAFDRDDDDDDDDRGLAVAARGDYGKTRGQLHGLLTKVRAYTQTRRAG